MDKPPPTPQGTWSPSWSILAAAVGIVTGGFACWWWPSSAPGPSIAAAAPAPAASPVAASRPPAVAVVQTAVPASGSLPPGPAARAASRIPRVRAPGGDPSPDITDFINGGEVPTMGEVIDRLHQAGVHSGLGAFNPPGTRPALVGLAVPEGFALPEGYVRHYQATDDGQRIEPILMFAPGFQLLDAAGRPVAMPADRVVPPELAPPGLPIRRIAIPAPRDAARP